MNRIQLLVITLCISCIPTLLQAAAPWTLSGCIQYALRHNLGQYQYELNERSSRISSRQAKMNLLPSLSASSSAGISYGRAVDPETYEVVNNTDFFQSSFSLGASVPLFNGFILQNKIGYAKYQHEVQKWEQVNHADDLAFLVMTAYYDLIYYKGLAKIAQEQLALSEYNVKKTEKQIEVGLKARTDLAEMQAAFEKEKLNLMQSQNNAEEARLKLAQYLNLAAGDSIDITQNDEDSLIVLQNQLRTDSLFSAYVARSPYVKIAEANLKAASKEVAIARGSYSPSLSLNASVGSNYYETSVDDQGKTIPFRTQLDNNLGQYVGASLSIPIFAKNQLRSSVQQAKLEKEQAKTELETYRQTVYYELMNNSRELQALYQQYNQTGKQCDAEELAFRVAQRKYDEGILNVFDLLTVKNRLAGVKASLLSARLQFSMKEKVIDFYKGNRFWESVE